VLALPWLETRLGASFRSRQWADVRTSKGAIHTAQQRSTWSRTPIAWSLTEPATETWLQGMSSSGRAPFPIPPAISGSFTSEGCRRLWWAGANPRSLRARASGGRDDRGRRPRVRRLEITTYVGEPVDPPDLAPHAGDARGGCAQVRRSTQPPTAPVLGAVHAPWLLQQGTLGGRRALRRGRNGRGHPDRGRRGGRLLTPADPALQRLDPDPY
jgi:hypothetical protein